MPIVDGRRVAEARRRRLGSCRELWDALVGDSEQLLALVMDDVWEAEISAEECRELAAALRVAEREIEVPEEGRTITLDCEATSRKPCPQRLQAAVARVIWRMMTTVSYAGRHVGTSWLDCETLTEREAIRYLLEAGLAYEYGEDVRPCDKTLWSFYVGPLCGGFYTNGF